MIGWLKRIVCGRFGMSDLEFACELIKQDYRFVTVGELRSIDQLYSGIKQTLTSSWDSAGCIAVQVPHYFLYYMQIDYDKYNRWIKLYYGRKCSVIENLHKFRECFLAADIVYKAFPKFKPLIKDKKFKFVGIFKLKPYEVPLNYAFPPSVELYIKNLKL